MHGGSGGRRSAGERWAGLALALLLGCDGGSATQLLLVVDTDLEPGVEIAAVRATATIDGQPSAAELPVPSEEELPLSLGVAPGAREDAEVGIDLQALDPDGAVVLGWRARTRFLPGEARRLDAVLTRRCGGEPLCEAEPGTTCRGGACVDEWIDPESLPAARPGEAPADLVMEPRRAPDGGGDDAGLGDGGACAEGAPCMAGPCALGELRCGGDAPRCEEVERLAEGAACGEGRTCDAEGRCGRMP